MANARSRAVAHIGAVVDSRGMRRSFSRKVRRLPQKGKRAMARSAAWWHAQAAPRIPVAATRRARRTSGAPARGALYRKHGRGQLRKSTRPYSVIRGDTVRGGIVIGRSYGLWLMAGTRTIAKGRVLAWRPGRPLVTDWPAKRNAESPNYKAAMPIVIPWHHKARNRLKIEIAREGI